MKKKLAFLLLIAFLSACASSGGAKMVVWETTEIPRAYEVVGPVSVTLEVAESPQDTIQGLAGFISKDGRISGQIPAEIKTALELRKEKYKEMIFEKLTAKAKEYGAEAVMGAEYTYIPSYITLSNKAVVSAKGMMIRYKG